MKVIFSHGKESGPWGSKIRRLAGTAEALGFKVDSIDYSGINNPDERVIKLCEYLDHETGPFVLVGSSMGGYVSLVAAERYRPIGLFLLAPALYMDGYMHQEYKAQVEHLQIVHGWLDDIIPVEHSTKYAKRIQCSLHLIDGDHRLNSVIETVNNLFFIYLKNISVGDSIIDSPKGEKRYTI